MAGTGYQLNNWIYTGQNEEGLWNNKEIPLNMSSS
jgi:hypothetical protein